VLIRRETSSDVDTVRAVIAAAFARRDQPGAVPVEVALVDELRVSESWIPVGQALMHAVLGAADALDEPLVALLGDPGYYRRFGFRLARDFDINPPVPAWVPHFQARVLTAYPPSLRGTFAYPAPFDHL
jgi:putative acetyltransferase